MSQIFHPEKLFGFLKKVRLLIPCPPLQKATPTTLWDGCRPGAGLLGSLLPDMHMDVDAYGLGVLDTLKNPFNQPTPLVGSIEITK